MFHYLYKITNKLNNREYVGIHSTNNLDDGYFGSGTYLKRAIVKDGKENFTKEILSYYNSREELVKAEKEHVNLDYLKTIDTYNLIVGGNGVVTIVEKRNLFTEKERPPITYNKDIPEKDLIELCYYKEKLDADLVESERFNQRFTNMILSLVPVICEDTNKLYNDKRYHEFAEKNLIKIFAKQGINKYLYIKAGKDSKLLKSIEEYNNGRQTKI